MNGMCKLRGPKNDKWWRLPTKIGFRDHDYIQGSLPNDRHFPWISDVWLVNEPMRVLTRTGRISSQPMRVPPSETSSSG